MTDKERILTYLFRKFYTERIFPDKNKAEFFNKVNEDNIQEGDLILCRTTGIHEWTIGYLVYRGSGWDVPWVIKELDSEKECNMRNETFYKIPRENIPDEVLFYGTQRKTYEKCIKAINKLGYSYRYHSMIFRDNWCTLNARKPFSEDITHSVTFKYNAKTSIKSIVEKLKKQEETNE